MKQTQQYRSYSNCDMPAGDAIRPFLLHAYGGLYMDVDVECFDATDDMVDGFDLVSISGQPQWCCRITALALMAMNSTLCLARATFWESLYVMGLLLLSCT